MKWAPLSFPLLPKEVVTINGCGGKTSLMLCLARQNRKHKTLVTTSTHIGMPPQSAYDFLISSFEEDADVTLPPPVNYHIENGITLALDVSCGKIKSPPLNALENLVKLFDYAFIEGDGSRTLPLKGWAEYEPVVLQATTMTIGVISLWTLGKRISDKIVHRLPLFLTLTNSKEGEVINLNHFAKLISGSVVQEGLFKNARGRKILFINQVEDGAALQNAKELLALLPNDFLSGLSAVIAGSVHNEKSITLWQNGSC